MTAELVTAIVAIVTAVGVSLTLWNKFKSKFSQIRKQLDPHGVFGNTLLREIFDYEAT